MYSSKHYAAKSEKSSIKSEDFAKQSEEFAVQASEATNARWNIFDVAAKDYEIPYEAKWGFEPLGQYAYKNAVAGEHYGYPDFYETCIRELNECPEGEETIIGNFSVTLYKHPNGHVFYNDFVEGEFVDGIFGEQGEAWYYGIDMENERIKLPRSTKRFEDLPEGSVLYMVVGNVKNDDLSWVDIVTQVDKGVKDIADTEAGVLENIQRAEEVALGNIEEQSFSVRNIGDIFYTNRIQDNLNGAVECDGKLYKFVDFTGDQTVENLLKQEKLPYISLSEYDLWMKGEPLNVEVVGTPKIENGVASEFSSTSWLVLPELFNPEEKGWELHTSFTLASLGTEQRIFNSSSVAYEQLGINVNTNNLLRIASYINNTATLLFEAIGTTVLEANKTYYIKVTYNPEEGYELSLSYDGRAYASEITSSVTSPIASGYNLTIGANFGANGVYESGAFEGSIDLSQSYIKINGEMWWQGGRGLEAHDSCRRFGWDGGEATDFRVPTIKGVSRTLVAQKLPSLADPSWFDWYSDGWLEQGNVQTTINRNSSVTVDLVKAFKDRNYIVTTQTLATGANNDNNNNSGEVYTKTNSSFVLYTYNYTKPVYWEAKGYTSIPNNIDWNYQDISNVKCMVQIANGKADVSMWDYNRQLQETTDEHIADIMSAGESIARYQQPIVPIEQTSGVVNLKTTNIYTMVIDGDTSFVLPTNVDTRFYNQIQLSVQVIGVPAVDWGTDIRFNREPIEIEPGFYDFHFDYDNLQQAWVVGYMSKGTVE